MHNSPLYLELTVNRKQARGPNAARSNSNISKTNLQKINVMLSNSDYNNVYELDIKEFQIRLTSTEKRNTG